MADKPTVPQAAWDVIIETIQRFFSKSPKYFRIIQWVGYAAIAITAIPDVLTKLGIVLPVEWDPIVSKIIFYAGIAWTVVSKLPTDNAQQIALDPTNNKLPVTQKDEIKKEEELQK